jgi:hypothetical protein
MGIYVFRRKALVELLRSPHDDFGSDVLPAAIHSHRVFGYTFSGYWEDIGDIRSFYEANLELVRPDPPFSFQDPVRPIYTRPRLLTASRIYDVRLDRVLMAEGCIVQGAEIANTVVGAASSETGFACETRSSWVRISTSRRSASRRRLARRSASARGATSPAPSSTRTPASAPGCGSNPSRAAPSTMGRPVGARRDCGRAKKRHPPGRHPHRARMNPLMASSYNP